MTFNELIDALEREAVALIDAAAADLDAALPSCPGWDARTLVNHVGRVHRWAHVAVLAAGSAPDGFPPKPDEVTTEWFTEGVTDLVGALRTAGAEAPAWTFLGAGTVQFWARRQALETAVHRWDAELASGSAAPIATELAVEGVGEVFDLHLPRALLRDGPPSLPAGSLHVHATDSDQGEWMVRATEGALHVSHGHEKGDAAVRGAASDLLLWLWGRHDIGDLEAFGDPDLAQAWASIHKG